MPLSVTIAGKQSLVVTPIGATVPVAITGNDTSSGQIEYRCSSTFRRTIGLSSYFGGIQVYTFDEADFFNNIAGGIRASNFDFINSYSKNYSLQTDYFDDNQGHTYTGLTSIFQNVPNSSGYPASIDSSTYPQLVPTGSKLWWNNGLWQAVVSVPNDPFDPNFFSAPGSGGIPIQQTFAGATLVSIASSKIYFPASGSSAYYTLTTTISGEIDYSVYYDAVKTDSLAITWNWGDSVWSGSYKENLTWNNDLTGINLAQYDHSFIKTNVSGNGAGLLGFNCVNGWQNSNGIFLYRGMAKNNSGVSQPYYIGRYRFCSSLVPSVQFGQRFIPAGVVTTTRKVELVSSGTILNGKVIGIGQDIDLPFPTTNPYPYAELGNNAVIGDFYFAVIGSTPPSSGFFGEFTQTTT